MISYKLNIKILYSPIPNFAGLDIAFMYSKSMLEISRRTNIFFTIVITSYQIDKITTITMNEPLCIISSIGDTVCEIVGTY